jgi:hypothetical protein
VVKKFWRKVTELCDKIQVLDKIMETLQILYAFLCYYGGGQPFAFSTATVLLEEQFQVALKMLEVAICFSLWSPKLTTVFQ